MTSDGTTISSTSRIAKRILLLQCHLFGQVVTPGAITVFRFIQTVAVGVFAFPQCEVTQRPVCDFPNFVATHTKIPRRSIVIVVMLFARRKVSKAVSSGACINQTPISINRPTIRKVRLNAIV